MSQYLPNLRDLDLRYSKKLIKIPHFEEFPNLERLNLEGCIKLRQLDSSIWILTKLVYLNLKDCKNLFYHSSLLNWNMLHSSFPTPTTHTKLYPCWHRLRELDLSYCGLRQIPDVIGCLHWLEALDLGGNNFVTVPSLRELSKLVYLSLAHCKLLKSLPVLPSLTAIEHGLYKNSLFKSSWPTGLFIFNCPKLGEMERWSSMTLSWMIQVIQANPQIYSIHIVAPGSEMPSWFNNQSKGSLIRVDSSPIMHDINNNIIGCVCCVVFSMNPTMIRSSSWEVNLVLKFSDGTWQNFFPVNHDGKLITVKSNHIWLTYYPLKSFSGLLNEILYVDINNKNNKDCLCCGYRWVYKEDLQEFNFANMNHINTLAGKSKFLAIEDEA